MKQVFATHSVPQLDHFLLLHYAKIKPFYDRFAKNQGIGPHPHQVFSPVTFVIAGDIHHRDSPGNSQITKVADVQWMLAGAGIVHSECPSEDLFKNKGNKKLSNCG